jgi:hypothetical protein
MKLSINVHPEVHMHLNYLPYAGSDAHHSIQWIFLSALNSTILLQEKGQQLD